jgi:hypothetical protein
MNKAPEFPPVHIIAFQGQRDLPLSDGIARTLREQLQAFHPGETRLLALSSLIGPADFIFGREALELGIPLAILLPLPAAEMKSSLAGTELGEFEGMLEKAVSVQVLSPTPHHRTVIALGEKLIDEADTLLVVWNGAEERTAELISYAAYRERTIISLLAVGNALEVHRTEPTKGGHPAPIAPEVLQKKLGERPPEPVVPEELLRYFHACDEEATRTAPSVRRYFLNIVLANAIASVAGSVGSSFPQTHTTGAALNIIRFACVLLGLGIFLMLRHRQSQNLWLGLRLRAELCRSAIATWLSSQTIEPIPPEQAPDLCGLIQTIRYFHTVHRPRLPVTLEQFKADYAERRLLDQMRYFQRQADSAHSVGSRLTPFYWFFTSLSLLTAATSFLYQTYSGRGATSSLLGDCLFVFVPAMAPALASWILAFQGIQSVGRRRARFREMERLMHQSLFDLTRCQTEDDTHHLVKKIEKLLLSEVLEWYSFVKYGR